MKVAVMVPLIEPDQPGACRLASEGDTGGEGKVGAESSTRMKSTSKCPPPAVNGSSRSVFTLPVHCWQADRSMT